MQDLLLHDYLRDILIESQGFNQDATSLDEYTIENFRAQKMAHSYAKISLKFDASMKDNEDTTPLTIQEKIICLKYEGHRHVQEDCPIDLVMNLGNIEEISAKGWRNI